ncbi:hypothetical protein G5I_11605 [Acromyrmex echinatior]|uniref:Uncharacterized protein n=1 Tax=Acromyrmex echinatior TaxID=103372 RepID=F4X023_ACREC|nr:hypothetical protein G5I_11605 [Acromyrmex echinatior]
MIGRKKVACEPAWIVLSSRIKIRVSAALGAKRSCSWFVVLFPFVRRQVVPPRIWDDKTRLASRNSNEAVLSWLCKKGEDILSKHAQHIATNLTSARLHEREFEKFYFTSMVSNIDCPIAVNGIERRAPRGIELLS